VHLPSLDFTGKRILAWPHGFKALSSFRQTDIKAN
jgi:hypothetical protein